MPARTHSYLFYDTAVPLCTGIAVGRMSSNCSKEVTPQETSS